jgi:hypothetical protein
MNSNNKDYIFVVERMMDLSRTEGKGMYGSNNLRKNLLEYLYGCWLSRKRLFGLG